MIYAIIQARMGSSRLPGKALREFGGRPALSWVLRAARDSAVADQVVVATSTDPEDDVIAAFAAREHARCVRGPNEDVLSRFLLVLQPDEDATVIRLTADCPLLDPVVIKMVVAAFQAGRVDYISTVTPRSLPRGLDVEVVAASALRVADTLARGTDRSHVTSYVYRHPDQFRIAGLTFSPSASDLRVTLDTPDDATLLDEVVDELGDRPPPWHEVVALLRRRPDLVSLNAHVEHKALEDG